MTHIHGAGYHQIGPALARGQMIGPTGLAGFIAAGIFAELACAFGAGRNGFSCLPPAFDVRCGIASGGCILPEPKAQWTAKIDGANSAKIDLGDGYRLEVDERSSQLTIINDKTSERTRIWGDPHVEIDGKHAYDFWGTTTFTLENGTKITINTEQWGGNPNAYVASQVVITKGDNAIVVDGISQNKLGDLSISLSNDGEMIDALTRDGYTLHENACGSGWRTETGKIATQTDLNATAVGRAYGPGSALSSLGELADFLSSFLTFGIFASFLNTPSINLGERPEPVRPLHRQLDWIPR
ncbi:MAG: DUF1521 domain-containing protein [Sphingorhabdus sp.]